MFDVDGNWEGRYHQSSRSKKVFWILKSLPQTCAQVGQVLEVISMVAVDILLYLLSLASYTCGCWIHILT